MLNYLQETNYLLKMNMKNKITLVMIVKNEEKALPRLLQSLKPHIDAAVIHDTGSTDNTIKVIQEELKGVDTTIRQVEWKSFGENRTSAIKDAGNDGYLILADADFEYFIEAGALANLTKDGYFVPIVEASMVYSLMTLVKAGLDWQYVGRTHEYLNHAGRSSEPLSKDKIYIKHHHDGGSRSDKFTRDLQLLQEDYAEDPNNVRTVFYLAQTYECLGNHKEAVNWYLKRAEMGGWVEEVYIAKMRAGKLSDNISLLLEAYSYRPERLEALYEAAIRLRSAPHVVIDLLKDRVYNELPSDILFVENYVWDFGLKFELGQAYSKIGRKDDSDELFKNILDGGVPEAYRQHIANSYPHLEHV